ncbi:MAG: hypothetical protein LBL91_01390 [Lachnospiraceae bacterium]|jgi:CobQ-like glutamine amidotransferase family enzyme|nr:hypothetical protein [Lachnospiraceae bacterium]
MIELNVAWMYPDILCLHGDRGNLLALKIIGEKLDVNVVIHRINSYGEDIDFSKIDLVLFPSGEIKVISKITEDLLRYKEVLKDKSILAIGTAGSIIANKTTRKNGEEIKGLGIIDIECIEREKFCGDDIYFEVDDFEMIGVQIPTMDIKLNEVKPLGKIKYGYGNDGKEFEGAQDKNIIFTNCLGPVLVKNPWFTEQIIKKAMKNKGVEIEKNINKEEYDYEINSLEYIKKFIAEKESK